MDSGKSFRFQIEDEPEVLSFLCWARALELDADGLDGDAAFKSSRRRSRKVFVRALETFLPQSFELLITAMTIILRLQFENTQKAITLLGNLSPTTFAPRTFLGNHRLFLLIIYFHRVSEEKMIGLERGAILIKLRLRRKR